MRLIATVSLYYIMYIYENENVIVLSLQRNKPIIFKHSVLMTSYLSLKTANNKFFFVPESTRISCKRLCAEHTYGV